jgi:hypothetical protein
VVRVRVSSKQGIVIIIIPASQRQVKTYIGKLFEILIASCCVMYQYKLTKEEEGKVVESMGGISIFPLEFLLLLFSEIFEQRKSDKRRKPFAWYH